MALSPGTRLGPYEIQSAIGAGGMGEVYRALDTKLNRDVALKVLPEAFALDAERLARFKREAQVLASLNHPNIAIVHDFEELDGIHALVMELVEGPTLAEEIARRARPSGRAGLPLDDALPIARQIVNALEAAHAQGVIHRDLKPANIKLRQDGSAKVLDFGLAKALGSDVGRAGSTERGPAYVVTQSPTITTPAMTMAGVILGTAAYEGPSTSVRRSSGRQVGGSGGSRR
jgi:eukaryotic-like serine/threonine-protein kinase